LTDVHEQLRLLLAREGAIFQVIEHPAEGRTVHITRIRGNRLEQAIKSMVVQVRLTHKENIYCLANVPGDCRVDFEGLRSHFNADSAAMAQRGKAEALTGCIIGAIPPFSFNADLLLLADPLIKLNREIVFNAARLDRSIFMRLDDYARIANPQWVNIALRPA
jgi:Ala-tRNA(Pro) deacylase